MSSLQSVRGTHDLLPEAHSRHSHVIDTARAVAARHGFAEVATPIFEFTEVFARTMGETSDVVSKEMYSFTDRSGEAITLRPEYTAGIARAFITHGLYQRAPFKVFAQGPMFRYERPQKGRQRQFHQIDIDVLGVAEPDADVEAIAVGANILEELGLLGRTRLELNTLGDSESRAAYRDVLVAYFQDHLSDLSEDSRARLQRNPLRILDSKDEGDRRVVAGAPLLDDHLNAASADFFAEVCAGLELLGISYRRNPRLVRGLDYYTHTAFEFVTDDLGAQGAVIAGGRYDGLIEALGGRPTPGIGWAGGVERLAMLAGDPPPAPRPVAVVPVGESCEPAAKQIAQRLRRRGFIVEHAYRGSLRRRLKRADGVNAACAVLLGEDEMSRDAATVRDLETGTQDEVRLDDLEERLARYR